jgi:DNA-binding transcriptional MerR regulator
MSEEAMTDNTAEEAGETEAATMTLLTAEQVAERLGISTRRLRDWRKDGKIAEVGRFKRGTARIPLFDPADVARLLVVQETEETTEAPATAVATVANPRLFAEAVAQQVRLVLAERSEAEAAAVAPLVELVREQQVTIDELRRRAEVAEAERDRLAAAQAAQDGPGSAEAPTPDSPGSDAPAGFWARVRRVFGA